jgi:hypothetical protein
MSFFWSLRAAGKAAGAVESDLNGIPTAPTPRGIALLGRTKSTV